MKWLGVVLPALLCACAESVAVNAPDLATPDLYSAPTDGPCASPLTTYRAIPEATFLGNVAVSGLCMATVLYCSESGVAAQTAPAGYKSAVSAPGGCDLNECQGRSCQQTFCKDCKGDCATACPR